MLKSFVIKIADINFLIHPYGKELIVFCNDYIVDEKHEYEIKINKSDIQYEDELYELVNGYRMNDMNINEQFALLRAVCEILAKDKNIFLFHSSSLIYDAKAYLFTATSGTGKSTHARLWIDHIQNTMMLNDDKPFIALDDKLTVYSSPWLGKEKVGIKTSAPLGAIVCLKQGDTNKIIEMSRQEKWNFIYNQSFRSKNPESIVNTMKFVDYIIDNVKIIGLECKPDKEAAILAYKELIENK